MSSNKPLQPHHGEIPHHDAQPVTPMEAFLENNFRKIIMAALAAVGVAAVVGLVRYKSGKTEAEAGQLVSSAKTVEDCDLVVQKYSGTVAAGNALLLKADLLWKANKKDSAVGVLRDFTKSFPKHPFFVGGLLGLASKLEAAGDKAEAKSIYERVSSEHGKSEFAPLAQIRLGDMLWSDGKEAEAKKLFEGLPGKYPGELTVAMSKARIDLIDAGLPTKEVDGPPKPKTEDKPAGAAATSAPIQITPGGVTPIKLEAGKNGTISPTIQLTPQGTAPGTAPTIKLNSDVKPAVQPAAGGVKMIEPKLAPDAPVKPGDAKPALKIAPPVQKITPPPGSVPAPALKVAPQPAAAPKPAAAAPPPPSPAPVTPPADASKK
ncbi:MAG: tetratricopeptide repeat protein [Verrucomicrobiaceae bacterium]|nr:tetratricopeptide repeat protein [Verrucomicrobiaceae bacterium]